MSAELTERLTERLAHLEQEATALREKLSAISVQIQRVQLQLIEQTYGVTIGGIVTDRQGIEYKITSVSTRWFPSKPWLEGNPKKKDGTFGTAHRNLYGAWEVVK